MVRNILIVCTGNICRSPMAEAVLRKYLDETGIQVSSAGTSALQSFPADPFSCQVMEENGFDISGHRARQATQEILLGSDLILILDRTHGEWIRTRFPELQGRVHKLGRWRGNVDIEDPYRKPKFNFDHAYQEISNCSGDWVKRIKLL